MLTGVVIIGVLLILVLYVMSTYNKFIRLKNNGDEAYAQLDAHLKQRYDLIPNLVETVKGYAKHEEKTLTAVIQARNIAAGAKSVGDKDKAEHALEGTLKTLFAVAESYPELKANKNFENLQNELTRLEKEILQARKYYNAVVKTFNTSIEVFPGSLIAGFFGSKFQKMTYLENTNEERQNVKVSFS